MKLEKLTIKKNASIRFALNKLDKSKVKGLIVVDNNKKLIGTLSSADLRKAILKKRA